MTTAFGKTGAPCSSCGSRYCDGIACYFETPEAEDEESISTLTLDDLKKLYGSQLTDFEPKKRPDGRWEIAA